MLAVIKTPHTEVKLETTNEQDLLDVLKVHFKILNIQKQNPDVMPFEKSFVHKETSGNRIGGRVRAMRRRAGITQEELAKKASIKQSHISEIENGKREIKTSEVAKKIARVFDVDYRYFV